MGVTQRNYATLSEIYMYGYGLYSSPPPPVMPDAYPERYKFGNNCHKCGMPVNQKKLY